MARSQTLLEARHSPNYAADASQLARKRLLAPWEALQPQGWAKEKTAPELIEPSNWSCDLYELGPPVVLFYPFLRESSPTKIDYCKKGTLILTSLLEDLALNWSCDLYEGSLVLECRLVIC